MLISDRQNAEWNGLDRIEQSSVNWNCVNEYVNAKTCANGVSDSKRLFSLCFQSNILHFPKTHTEIEKTVHIITFKYTKLSILVSRRLS